MTFRTRFAPSPTGPLHLGHAYSAILAHDLARAEAGAFLVRMEDTDAQRSKPEWDAKIIDDLNWLGLSWDEPILRQSERLDHYTSAIARLEEMGLLYPCSCSRSQIQAAIAAPQEGATHDVYPGTCKHRSMATRKPGDALRLHLDLALERLRNGLPSFDETGPSFIGTHTVDVERAFSTIGDIVLFRKGDGTVAYFLASALDDAAQSITQVVRGVDLFDFTTIQVILLKLLGLPVPSYHHHPLIRDENGKRLAKRDDARSIETYRDVGKTPADIRLMVGL